MQLELDDLDGVGRQRNGEVAARIVEGRFDRNDPFGIVDGVGGLSVRRADANDLCIGCGVRARQCQRQWLWIG